MKRLGVGWSGKSAFQIVSRRPSSRSRLNADVIEAVKLAGSRGLRISVRTGGHSWIATSLRDGGMLIDLSQFNGITVDVQARTAIAQPAIRNTEVMAALARHGLAFPAGHCPHNETLTVAAMRVCNPDRSPLGING
jgi:FAD/FMN-containing dehydrogenase